MALKKRMSRGTALLLVSAACLVAVTVVLGAAPAPAPTSFNNIQVCVPFNVLVAPSKDATTYAIEVNADQQVKDAIKASVSGNTLNLESSGSFQTNNPIRVTIRLPATALQGKLAS